jgi:hypothetical protein
VPAQPIAPLHSCQTLLIPFPRSQNGAPVAGLPSCTPDQLTIFQQYRDKQLAAVGPALQVPHTGAFIDSCFVHEQNVDYCSGQSLPNCLGWNVYNVSVPGSGAVTMDDAYFGGSRCLGVGCGMWAGAGAPLRICACAWQSLSHITCTR